MLGPFKLKFWILDDKHHAVAVSVGQWGAWFENFQNRIVDNTQINSAVSVSTIFIGIDHRFGGDGPPLLFETMIFGGKLDTEQWRYSSWDDAVAGHATAVRRARAAAHQRVGAKVPRA